MEVLHGLVGIILGLLQDFAGLLVGFSQDAVALGVQLLLLLLQSLPEGTDFLFMFLNFCLLQLNGAAAALQIG